MKDKIVISLFGAWILNGVLFIVSTVFIDSLQTLMSTLLTVTIIGILIAVVCALITLLNLKTLATPAKYLGLSPAVLTLLLFGFIEVLGSF